jgi:nitroreductase
MKTNYEMFYNLCESRRSCRSFNPDPIPEELIEKILKVAATSPFASGRKNWRIEVIRDRQLINSLAVLVRSRAEAMAAEMDDEMAVLFKRYLLNFTQFEEAPVLLIPVFRISPIMQSILRDRITPNLQSWERDNAVKSISCVSMLILMAAHSLNLGSCYMTGPLIASEELSAILNLAWGQEIGAIIPVGYHLI